MAGRTPSASIVNVAEGEGLGSRTFIEEGEKGVKRMGASLARLGNL